MKAASIGTTRRLLNPPFVIAVTLLGTAAILSGPVARRMDLKQNKIALPLKTSLNAMAVEAIKPYRVAARYTLEPTVLAALGTNQYLNWRLEDTSVDRSDPLRIAELFITYDTGGRNLVPHTPDECRAGAGYQPAQPHENSTVELRSLGSELATVPIRVCTFVKTALFNREKVTVVYTFGCNGRFAATRTGVRLLINDPRNTFAYFSKVEVSFPRANRQQSTEGARKLFDRILPVLIRDHWPDFEEEEEAVREAAAHDS